MSALHRASIICWTIASLAVAATILVACAGPPAKPVAGAAAGGARQADGRFVNVESMPESAGVFAQAGLWARKVWTTLAPREGAAERVEFDRNAMQRDPSVTWIGHATFLVRMDGVAFLTDPMFSDWAAPLPYTGPRRLVPPGVPISELPKVDFAVISHDHYDHADLQSVRALVARGVRFIVPLGLGDWVRTAGGEAVELDWWQHIDIAGVRVHCVPAQHGSGRTLNDAGQRLWSGWYVSGPTRRFYHAGDTGYATGLAEIGKRLGAPHLAAVPIGAYHTPMPGPYFHTTPVQALKLGMDVEASRIVGMHYGTFDISDEPLAEPSVRFMTEGKRLHLGADRLWLLKVGETRGW